MVTVVTKNGYNVAYAQEEDSELLEKLLNPVVVAATEPSNKRLELDKLRAWIRYTTRYNKALLLLRKDEAIGAVLLDDRKKRLIVHTVILEEYKGSIGTGVLYNYILNDLFRDHKVYFYSRLDGFDNVSTEVKSGMRELDEEVALNLRRMFGE